MDSGLAEASKGGPMSTFNPLLFCLSLPDPELFGLQRSFTHHSASVLWDKEYESNKLVNNICVVIRDHALC